MRLGPGSRRSRRFGKGAFWAIPQLLVAKASASRSLWEASAQLSFSAGAGNLANLASTSRIPRLAPRLEFIVA
jgi:hypothetical protein